MTIALKVRLGTPMELPRKECAMEHPDYPLYTARLLDWFAQEKGDHRPVAEKLGFSATGLAKKITRDPQLLEAVNAMRLSNGLPPLR